MPQRPLSDEEALEALQAVQTYGGHTAAAEALGIPRSTIRSRWSRAMERGMHLDPAVKDSMAAVGTGMVPSLVWAKTKSQDGTSYSTLLKPKTEDVLDIADRLADVFEGLTPIAPIKPPASIMADLCTVYPGADMHLGMHAWGQETGNDDYDIKRAEADVEYAFGKVMAYTPNSDTAIFLLPGDTFHADDNRAETPQSRHKLDVDSRHWKVMERGIAIIDSVIQRLLGKHNNVIVRVMRGNHDEHSHLVLTFALAERYRDNVRVNIEKTPRDLFMFQWGRVAIFSHHGDKAKPQQLALYLSDVCPFWSDTRHRIALTGHVHHDQAKDVGPLRWESLRAFCPPDAYAASMGYGSRRALQSMTFDKQDGLVLRAIDPIERNE